MSCTRYSCNLQGEAVASGDDAGSGAALALRECGEDIRDSRLSRKGSNLKDPLAMVWTLVLAGSAQDDAPKEIWRHSLLWLCKLAFLHPSRVCFFPLQNTSPLASGSAAGVGSSDALTHDAVGPDPPPSSSIPPPFLVPGCGTPRRVHKSTEADRPWHDDRKLPFCPGHTLVSSGPIGGMTPKRPHPNVPRHPRLFHTSSPFSLLLFSSSIHLALDTRRKALEHFSFRLFKITQHFHFNKPTTFDSSAAMDSSPVRSTTATFDHYPAEFSRRRSSAGSSGNSGIMSSQKTSIPVYHSGAHAVHCHQCGSIFVISNTCSNCNHRQCKDCY